MVSLKFLTMRSRPIQSSLKFPLNQSIEWYAERVPDWISLVHISLVLPKGTKV
jgi:hypothetical protein